MRRSTPSISLSAQASAAAPRSPPVLMDPEAEFEAVLAISGAPPTLSQLNALTAIPSAMAGAMNGRSAQGRRKKGRRQRLVREGQIVSKMFDALGSRPQPTNGLSLEQGITLELQVAIPAWLASSTIMGANTFTSQAFTINQFAAAASVLSVFDQYRFEQIEVWIEYRNANASFDYPELYSAVDLDDANPPVAVGNVADHLGSIVSSGPGGHYHKWKPHVALATFSGAFTSYANTPSQWIDSASPNVQHYGLKALMTASGAASISVSLVIRAVVSFRAPAIN